jgi:prepilin-type N-terminal cleavage/methylation domain-containing protein
MRKKKGFTLVELLVVIAIIALLMSMLMPVIGKVKRQAKDVVCQSNLRQWGAVFSMYANDNQGRFMGGWMGQALTKHTDQWPSALRPYYADNGDLRLCPMVTKLSSKENGQGAFMPLSMNQAWGAFAGTPGGPSTSWEAAAGGDYGSYGINAWVCNPVDESIGYPALIKSHWRGDNVREAAAVPLFADCAWLDAWPIPREGPPPFPDWVFSTGNYDNSMRRVCIPRHNVHVNYLFLDYSVDRVDLKQLWVLKWHRTFNICGPWTQCGGVQPQDWPQWMRNLKDY